MLLCASGLRISAIGAKSVWFDEVFVRSLIRYSTSPELITGKIGDLTPPLYYLLGKGWLEAVGDSELSMRMFSALPSLLAVAMVAAATRRLFNRHASLWALAFVALAPAQVYYAQEVRFYSLTNMWSACLLWGLAVVWRGKRYGLAIYLLGAIGGLYTHYFFGILLAVVHLLLGVYWLSGARPRSLIRPPWSWLLGADIALLVLYLPQLARFFTTSSAVLGSFWIIRPSPAAPITTMTFMLFGVTLPGFLLIVAIVTTVCALVIGGLDISRYSKALRGVWWALIATVVGRVDHRSDRFVDGQFHLQRSVVLAALTAADRRLGWQHGRPTRDTASRAWVLLARVDDHRLSLEPDAIWPRQAAVSPNRRRSRR